MHKNPHIQTVALDLSRGREQEPSISGTFVRLNVLDYKRAEQIYQFETFVIQAVWRQVACSKVVRILRIKGSANEMVVS